MLANCIWHNIVLDETVIFLAEIFLRPTVTQLEPVFKWFSNQVEFQSMSF